MKVLITGANGFIGKNLQAELKNTKYKDWIEPLCFDCEMDEILLDDYCSSCDFVIHLAGINRPKDESEFMEGNFGFTSLLLELLTKHHNKAPILITSSIQAALDNPYGKSKKAGEELIFHYGKENGIKVFVYRLPNVFGKWCKPNYNSAIATFCYNIAHELPIQVNDREHQMKLVYIDDVICEIINALQNQENRKEEFCYVSPVIDTKLGEIVDTIYSFKTFREKLAVPNHNRLLERYLYATYLSYLPEDQFAYDLNEHIDNRGSFTEIIRTNGQGQFSLNICHPGIAKGNHFHHTKNEKFLVVQGEAIIAFRKIGTEEVIEYRVSGKNLKVVDIPTGYTHLIKNIGEGDLLTFMWANEPFDPTHPDTIFENVYLDDNRGELK